MLSLGSDTSMLSDREEVNPEEVKTPVVLITGASGSVYSVLGTPLGEGAFATLYKGVNVSSRQVVAIKFYSVPVLSPDEFEHFSKRFYKEKVLREYVMLSRNIPGMCKVLEPPIVVDNDKFYLVLEYIHGKTLYHFLTAIPEQRWNSESALHMSIEILDMMKRLVEMVAEMNRLGMFHMDLHAGNVMIKHDDHSLVIIDPGMACLEDSKDYPCEFDGLQEWYSVRKLLLGMINGNVQVKKTDLDTAIRAIPNDFSEVYSRTMTILNSTTLTYPLPIFK